MASEVRAMLGTDDLSGATLDQVHRAIYDYLLPSDKTFMEGMEAARNIGRKSRPRPAAALPEETGPEYEPAPAPAVRPEYPPARGRGNLVIHEPRPSAVSEASLIET